MKSMIIKNTVAIVLFSFSFSLYALNDNSQQETVSNLSKEIAGINIRIFNAYKIQQAIINQKDMDLKNSSENNLLLVSARSVSAAKLIVQPAPVLNAKSYITINEEQIQNVLAVKNGYLEIEYLKNGKIGYGYIYPTNLFMQRFLEIVFSEALKVVMNLKNEYNNNPYIAMKGFDINIGIPPSISVSFDFK